MEAPMKLTANEILQGVIDTLQGAKKIVTGAGHDLVDFGQDGVTKIEKSLDDAIDYLQSKIS